MNKKLEETESELEEKLSKIFHEFMTMITKFEQLTDIAKQFLVRFHQEIEKFRKPNIENTSDLVRKLIDANYTDRMKAYLEAGSRNVNESAQNISNLEGLLREIECLTEDAISIMRVTNQTTSSILGELYDDTHQILLLEEELESAHLRDKSISLVIIMRVLYAMLKLDYSMQEKIIRSLNVVSPSSELESYCFMWDLRPYVDENWMRLAWKHVQ